MCSAHRSVVAKQMPAVDDLDLISSCLREVQKLPGLTCLSKTLCKERIVSEGQVYYLICTIQVKPRQATCCAGRKQIAAISTSTELGSQVSEVSLNRDLQLHQHWKPDTATANQNEPNFCTVVFLVPEQRKDIRITPPTHQPRLFVPVASITGQSVPGS